MGTRLLSEHIIKKRYPHLRYVRVHTDGKNTATIYAWNDDLHLPESDKISLQQFAMNYLLPCVRFKVKDYRMVQSDQVPVIPELPEPIIHAALSRTLNQQGILSVINGLFPHSGTVTYTRYDYASGAFCFEVRAGTICDIERELIRQYLQEILPLGSYVELTFTEMS